MKVVIFGAANLATLAWYALAHDGPHEVVGFTVDSSYPVDDELKGLPVVAFEALERHFPPSDTAVLVALGLANTTGVGAARRQAARARGYSSISYVSARAITWPDLRIGEGCMIFAGTNVEPFVSIGDGTIVRGGCHISHHATIADQCFLAPRVTVGGGAEVAERCFLGIGAVVQSGVRVAPGCFVAAGARVTRDTEKDGVYDGAPARRRRVPPSRLRKL